MGSCREIYVPKYPKNTSDYDIITRGHNPPWKSREQLNYESTPEYTTVYTVFLGVINRPSITMLVKKMLEDKDGASNLEDLDLETKGKTCICSFQLNNYGKIIPQTFCIPDYFISMSCLKKKDEHPKTWMSLKQEVKHKHLNKFGFMCDVTQNREYKSLNFNDLVTLQSDLITMSELTELRGLVSEKFYVISSKIRVPNKFGKTQEGLKKFSNIKYYEEVLKEITSSEVSILNSFYLEELNMIAVNLSKKDGFIGKSLEDYIDINGASEIEKQDLHNDPLLFQKYSYPLHLPAARWPGNPRNPLSLGQQIAVNLALDGTTGIFSVNGPPGTGKSTLLRDIIAGIVGRRADALAEFDSPDDAFGKAIDPKIGDFTYKLWQLDPSLIGYEVVIASTNNNAVENISKEIPRRREIHQDYELDYFSDIASSLLEDDAWGLGSAVLGNKANRSGFFDKFWDKIPRNKNNEINDDEIKGEYGLKYLLTKKKPVDNWQECRKKFLATKKRYQQLVDEMQELASAIVNSDELRTELHKNKLSQDRLNEDLDQLGGKLETLTKQILTLDKEIDEDKSHLQDLVSLKPAWYVILLDFVRNGTIYRDWSNRCGEIIDARLAKTRKKGHLLKEIGVVKVEINERLDKWAKLEERCSHIDNKIEDYQHKILHIKAKHEWHSNIPDARLWSLPDSELQKTSPWVHRELQDVRAQIFVDAMNLHRSFIINAADKIINNMNSVRGMLNYGYWPSEYVDLLPHVWASFFLVVPTISTTFASCASLFGKLGANTIGYLLVDEAGQATPQAAAGAIFRAKKAIIVGDPMQIRPVITIPRALNQALLDYYKVARKWDVLTESSQTLADRANIYGTYLSKQDSTEWIGCPLRIHRRCMDPMFGVANKIAYKNLMVQATNYQKSAIENVFSSSMWIDVASDNFEDNWSQDEGKVALQLICKIIESTHVLPSLFVVTPFKHVAKNMIQYILSNSGEFRKYLSHEDSIKIKKWIYKSVGTVHTFQGKQAEAVIFLLGGNPTKAGAISWASKTPNLLNVAITRAKNLLFVIGSYERWSSKSYFHELGNSLPIVDPDEVFQREFRVRKFVDC